MTPNQLRQQRIALGLSYTTFAQPLGISPDDVMQWERGVTPMPPPFVVELALAYVSLATEHVRLSRAQHVASRAFDRRYAAPAADAAV